MLLAARLQFWLVACLWLDCPLHSWTEIPGAKGNEYHARFGSLALKVL